MLLTTAAGARIEVSSRAELERALTTLGEEGNDYATLNRDAQVWVNASRTGSDRFVAEHRDGSDRAHFSSTRTNLSRAEVLELFGSYLDGSDTWRASIEWERMDPRAPDAPGRESAARRAVRPDGGAAATIVVLFGVVGAALIGLGLHDAARSRAFLARSASAGGTIVAYTQADGRHTASYPIIQYRALDGRVSHFQGRVGSTPTQYRIGDRVPVLYDPARPEDAMIDDDTSLWYGAVGITAFGAMFGGVALYVLVRASWPRLRRAAGSPPRP